MNAFTLDPKMRAWTTVMRPKGAESPILPPDVRTAIHAWMTEIRAQQELETVGIEPRRTALLTGPPGCGKTTLAHHLASRLGLPLVCVHMDRLRSEYIGQTGQQIAATFEALAENAGNCVILLDEFDAIAAKRSDDGQASSREGNAIVNSLLTRIESFTGTLIAATNRADAIDAALWRRFGMQLTIPLPGDEERFAIITRYLEPFALPEDDRDLLTEVTAGAPPSLLRQLMEGVKRDLILAPRMGYADTEALATFNRVLAAIRPHSDYTTPPLWAEAAMRQRLGKLFWPPERPT